MTRAYETPAPRRKIAGDVRSDPRELLGRGRVRGSRRNFRAKRSSHRARSARGDRREPDRGKTRLLHHGHRHRRRQDAGRRRAHARAGRARPANRRHETRRRRMRSQTPDGPRNDDALELLAASNVDGGVRRRESVAALDRGVAASRGARRRRHDRPRADPATRHRSLAARVAISCWSKAPAGGSRRSRPPRPWRTSPITLGAAGDPRRRHAARVSQSRVADARSDPLVRAAVRRLDREQAAHGDGAWPARISRRSRAASGCLHWQSSRPERTRHAVAALRDWAIEGGRKARKSLSHPAKSLV